MEQDKSWLFINRLTPAFDKGLRKFIEYAKQFHNSEGKIKCPCRRCCNTKSQSLEEVYEHCFDKGWSPGYTTWFYHGETEAPEVSRKRSRTTQVVVEAGDKMTPVINDFLGRAPEEEVLQSEEEKCRKYANNHVKDKKPGPPPKYSDVDSPADWDQFLRLIASPKFTEKTNQNKSNRAKLKYVSTQGRRSMPGHRWVRLTMNNLNQLEQVGEHPIEVWADKHRRNGVFVNADAEEDYRRVIEAAERIAPDGLLTFETEARIFREALGPRRDYLKGLGPTQSGESASSSQSFQSPSSSTPDSEKIARLERNLKKFEARLQRLMSTLQAYIPGLSDVIEESSDDNEDVDEDVDVDLDDV